MDQGKILGQLALNFGLISLIAFGGASAALPEMHRMVVDLNHWMDSTTFTHLFALAQAAPGPNVMVVTLIGWQVAGFMGAVVATVAMVLPAFCLTYTVSRLLPRWGSKSWYRLAERGLAPVTVGLVLASAFLLTKTTSDSIGTILITIAAVLYILVAKKNPLHILALGALLGAFGVI
ncbi:chromate transporter [Microvirga sp. W0021]|uniref:Chromate transporter n=1 Tax=Hohaiivirga grylli TaxID=3133970 RepID=A0ABV0BHU2_9HYPH